MDPDLKSYLDKNNVKYIEHKHLAVYTVEESKKIKKDTGLHAKCLFLRDKKKNYYLIALPADKRLDIKALCLVLGVKKLNFASPTDLKEMLNVTPGSVSIFTLVNPDSSDVTLIMDQEVWKAKSVGFHPNINTATLELDHESLERYYNSLPNKKQILEL